MSKFVRIRALILRRTNYGEADRIINFLTTDGQITALARGVRKPRSKLAGALEPFSLIDLNFIEGKNGGMGRVTGASLIEHYHQIVASYERLEMGSFFLKITSKLSQDIDGDGWFYILEQTLRALNDLTIDQRLIKTWFNLQAAKMLGEELNLDLAADGVRLSLEKKYSYDPQEKNLFADDKAGWLTGDSLKLLKAINLYDLPTLARIKNAQVHLDRLMNLSILHVGLE